MRISGAHVGRRLFAAGIAALLAIAAIGAVAPPATAVPPPASDSFYTYTGSLAGIAPGEVLRQRPVPFGYRGAVSGIRSTQVLYRTTDQHGDPVVTVATVLRPPQPAAGAPKLLSYHMAYDALGAQCDPSYTLTGSGSPGGAGTAEQAVISGYLAAGYYVVVPDYEGENLEWTIGRQSAYAALDGVRAAKRVLRLPASTRVGLAGYSGGSVPTQWGAEVAPTYAPELKLVGAAAGGLPVDLAHNLPYVSGSKDWAGVIPALIVSYQRMYQLDTASFLSAKGAKIVNTVKTQCINAFAGKYPGLTDGDMVRAPYRSLLDVPSVVRAINDNIMGSSGTPRVPMLLGVGASDATGDGVMVTRDVQGLAHTYCTRGVTVTFQKYSGLTHGDAFFPYQKDTAQFFADRFAGVRPPGNCRTAGRGNSLAPTPMP